MGFRFIDRWQGRLRDLFPAGEAHGELVAALEVRDQSLEAFLDAIPSVLASNRVFGGLGGPVVVQAFQTVVTFTAASMPVTFPIAFLNGVATISLTLNDDPTANVCFTATQSSVSLTGFDIKGYTNTNAAITSGAYRFGVIAVGS